jgi:hypothetical protein
MYDHTLLQEGCTAAENSTEKSDENAVGAEILTKKKEKIAHNLKVTETVFQV